MNAFVAGVAAAFIAARAWRVAWVVVRRRGGGLLRALDDEIGPRPRKAKSSDRQPSVTEVV